MDFETFITDRLYIQRLAPEDFMHIFEHHNEEKLKEILGLYASEEFMQELSRYKTGYTSYGKSCMYFQLKCKETKLIFAGAGFYNWHLDHHKAELGYGITNEAYKCKGYMTEALKVVINYGFMEMKLNRIEACVNPNNIPSLKILEKFNFTKEGHLRQHNMCDGKIDDSLIFSLLKHEYLSSQNKHVGKNELICD